MELVGDRLFDQLDRSKAHPDASMSAAPLKKRIDWHLRHRLPRPAYHFVRRRYYDGRTVARRNPGRGRLLPDFLIIGTAKSGTTTLHGWLTEHPFIVPAVKKEMHFFDYDFYRGVTGIARTSRRGRGATPSSTSWAGRF